MIVVINNNITVSDNTLILDTELIRRLCICEGRPYMVSLLNMKYMYYLDIILLQ